VTARPKPPGSDAQELREKLPVEPSADRISISPQRSLASYSCSFENGLLRKTGRGAEREGGRRAGRESLEMLPFGVNKIS
jgi:hypothetical protein